MAHIPVDDARQLFNETNPKTWAQFHKVVQAHKGKAEGISDNLVDLMIEMSQHLEQSHQPFPSTPEQLMDVLNHRLAQSGHQGTP